MKKILICSITIFLLWVSAKAQQNVGVGTTTAEASAILDAFATDKGVLVPRTDTNTVYASFATPATGLLIYQTSDNKFYYFNGNHWQGVGGDDGITNNCVSTNMVLKSDGTSDPVCSNIFDDGTFVGIGTTTPGDELEVAGKLKTMGINETSDKRYKKEIQNIENALEKVSQMDGVYFNWKSEEEQEKEGLVITKTTTQKEIGVLAQDLEEVLPEVVNTDNQGYKSVQYSKLVAVLIEAIKELEVENKTLKASVNNLQNSSSKVDQLEEKVNRLYELLEAKSSVE